MVMQDSFLISPFVTCESMSINTTVYHKFCPQFLYKCQGNLFTSAPIKVCLFGLRTGICFLADTGLFVWGRASIRSFTDIGFTFTLACPVRESYLLIVLNLWTSHATYCTQDRVQHEGLLMKNLQKASAFTKTVPYIEQQSHWTPSRIA